MELEKIKKTVVTIVVAEFVLMLLTLLILDDGRIARIFLPAFVAHIIAILFIVKRSKGMISPLDFYVIKYGLFVLLLISSVAARFLITC